eukprot:4695345-Pyramimonas_sp.AAC.1
MITQMTDAWHELVRAAGWWVDLHEVEWISTEDQNSQISVTDVWDQPAPKLTAVEPPKKRPRTAPQTSAPR